MNADFEYQKGREDERAQIVAFLRRHTRLYQLAALLEKNAHGKTPAELAALVRREGAALRGVGPWAGM